MSSNEPSAERSAVESDPLVRNSTRRPWLLLAVFPLMLCLFLSPGWHNTKSGLIFTCMVIFGLVWLKDGAYLEGALAIGCALAGLGILLAILSVRDKNRIRRFGFSRDEVGADGEGTVSS